MAVTGTEKDLLDPKTTNDQSVSGREGHRLGRLMPSFARQAWLVSYKALSDIAGKAAIFGVVILAARTLPTEAFGVLSLATTLGWMVSVASDFGLQLHLAREVARAPQALGLVLWPLLRRRTQWASCGAVLIGLAASGGMARGNAWAFALLAAAPLLSSIVEFVNYAYRGLDRSEIESSINLAQRLATILLVLIVSIWSPALLGFAVAIVIPAAVALGVTLAIVSRLAAGTRSPSPTPSSGSLFSQVAPIGFGLVLSALYFRVDVFLLERLSGLDAVAHYSAVFRLVDALRLFPAAVLTVLLPRVFLGSDTRLALRLSAGLFVFGAATAAILAWIAPAIVGLAYGPGYAAAVPAFRVLLLSYPLLALNYGLTHQLIGWDGQRAYAAMCAVALVINVAMNAWLIPTSGGVGAAWATLGTEGWLTLACLVALPAIVKRRQTARARE